MRKSIAVAVVGAILLTATPASARIVVVDRDRAYGDGATAGPNGNVSHPKALFVKVKTNPTDKRVHVVWNVFCYRPSGTGSSSGDFYRRTPVYKRVRLPFADPGSCGFYATVQLTSGSANLTAVLLARV